MIVLWLKRGVFGVVVFVVLFDRMVLDIKGLWSLVYLGEVILLMMVFFRFVWRFVIGVDMSGFCGFFV